MRFGNRTTRGVLLGALYGYISEHPGCTAREMAGNLPTKYKNRLDQGMLSNCIKTLHGHNLIKECEGSAKHKIWTVDRVVDIEEEALFR